MTESVGALSVESRPAGAAPLGEVIVATGVIGGLSALLGVLAWAHRAERTSVLDRLVSRAEGSRLLGGLAGWASVPLMVAMASLITALVGMYWDIALHIGVGRDEGPLANPAHYPIMFGLFGVSAAGVLACVLPRSAEAGPASVRLSRGWHAPVGGVLLVGAGSYALLGFPLDDVWHRIFGQDVTLWGPTHLMLIGGAGLSLVAMAILYEEGRRASGSAGERSLNRVRDYVLKSCAMGGMLIGLSVFQAEFDFGVPQFRLVLQPLLIAAAAALTLTVARLWIGRGAAVAAVVFYLAVRGGVSVLVGPVLGELWASVPLYLVEALCVELVALVLARRALLLGAVSGLLVGTVGFAAEYGWTQVAYPLPWTSDILVEGVLMAVVAGVAGGVCGALLAMGLAGRLPATRAPKLFFAASIAAIAAAVANGLVISTPDDLTVTMQEVETADGEASTELRFNRPPTDDDPAWVAITAWQGGASGLHIDHLERVDDLTYRTNEPMPVSGTWKTLVRVHDGRTLAAGPLYLPEDTALDEPAVPAAAGETRPVGVEKEILQRELKDDVPGWLWLVAGLVVLACSLALVLALGWGTARYSRLRAQDAAPSTDKELIPAKG